MFGQLVRVMSYQHGLCTVFNGRLPFYSGLLFAPIDAVREDLMADVQ